MVTSDPASLAPIDEVEVVDLAGLLIDAGNFVTAAATAPSVRVYYADAQRIAALWRSLPSLPPGKEMRCHNPPFGLRFYASGNMLTQASICWQCNNIFGEARGEPLHYVFDGSQEIARELLALLEQVVGHPAAG